MRLAFAALLVTGCTIYLGDDDADDVPCDYGAIAPLRLINPSNLACEEFSGGCPDWCGPCALEADEPIPTWGTCDSGCATLDELTCATEPGCRAAHDWACWTGDGECTAEVSYLGCFAVDTTGPVQGTCEGLDAFECSRHDDCLALHDTLSGLAFVACVPESR